VHKNDTRTFDERKAAVEPALRSYRYKRARERIERIIDGWPPLTDEQREQLALLLHPGGSGE
jgi:hypothetical protein